MNTESKLAKIAEIKMKVSREGWSRHIPADKLKWPEFFREFRRWADITSADFWDLFNVPASTGIKYEQANPLHVRYPKRKTVETIAEAFGLVLEDPEAVRKVREYLEDWGDEHQEMMDYIVRHRLTLDDLKKYVHIRELLRD